MQICEEYLQEEPTNYHFNFYAGDLALQLGQREEGGKYLWKAFQHCRNRDEQKSIFDNIIYCFFRGSSISLESCRRLGEAISRYKQDTGLKEYDADLERRLKLQTAYQLLISSPASQNNLDSITAARNLLESCQLFNDDFQKHPGDGITVTGVVDALFSLRRYPGERAFIDEEKRKLAEPHYAILLKLGALYYNQSQKERVTYDEVQEIFEAAYLNLQEESSKVIESVEELQSETLRGQSGLTVLRKNPALQFYTKLYRTTNPLEIGETFLAEAKTIAVVISKMCLGIAENSPNNKKKIKSLERILELSREVTTITENIDLPQVRSRLADCYLREERYDQAIEQYSHNDQNFIRNLSKLMFCSFKKGDVDNVITLSERIEDVMVLPGGIGEVLDETEKSFCYLLTAAAQGKKGNSQLRDEFLKRSGFTKKQLAKPLLVELMGE